METTEDSKDNSGLFRMRGDARMIIQEAADNFGMSTNQLLSMIAGNIIAGNLAVLNGEIVTRKTIFEYQRDL